MKAPRFRYAKPRSLDEALRILAAEPDARLLAGGQSLVPALNMRLLEPSVLVDINHLPELHGVRATAGGLRLGALTRHAELVAAPLVAKHAPLLAHAAGFIAHPAIRNRGTLGGSLAQADPAAELPACAVALDAVLHLRAAAGTRQVQARDFFKGALTTDLAPAEILVAVEIPDQPGASLFLEFARRQGDYALAGLAGWVKHEGGRVRDARLVFFGVGSKPFAAVKTAQALRESPAAAEAALAAELSPEADINSSVKMKSQLASVLLRRALAGAEARAA